LASPAGDRRAGDPSRIHRIAPVEAASSHLAAEGVAKHFWPERLEVLAAMPRTPTGKIQKFVLREMARKLAPPSPAAA